MPLHTLPYNDINIQLDHISVSKLDVTIESEADSVAALKRAVNEVLRAQRAALIAGKATVSDANERGQRKISYRPDLAIAVGRITRLDFSVEGRRVKPAVVQADIEDWFPSAKLLDMTKSPTDRPSPVGCSFSLLALGCFGLLVAILVASIGGSPTDAGADPSVNVSSAPVVPNANNAAPLQPASVAVPVVDCSQIAVETQREQCLAEQAAGLCPNGCVEYPLQCDLQVVKAAIDPANGQKLYYSQQHPQYAQILIKSETGERWFCSTQSAERAGWVAAP